MLFCRAGYSGIIIRCCCDQLAPAEPCGNGTAARKNKNDNDITEHQHLLPAICEGWADVAPVKATSAIARPCRCGESAHNSPVSGGFLIAMSLFWLEEAGFCRPGCDAGLGDLILSVSLFAEHHRRADGGRRAICCGSLSRLRKGERFVIAIWMLWLKVIPSKAG